ncbi:MAG: AMP phosphorylase [Candidatus Diapherotrites archaeon]
MPEKYTQKMKAKLLDIEAGKLIAIMNEIDAKEFGIFPLDRVELMNHRTKKSVVTVVDTTDTMVGEDEVGIFADVSRLLDAKESDSLEVMAVGKPKSVEFIRKKMDGKKLSPDEIKAIIDDFSSNRLSEIEASAFISAIYILGISLDEIVSMTKALISDGKQLSFEGGPVLDKHSVGGVNGRATMIIVPIIAAAGYLIPKTSSRSITSASGTADAMEVLCNVSLTLEEIKEITEKVGGVIAWGGAVDLAPADDKIIKIEHPLSLDPEGQVIASVMAKKASVGAKFVVIDLPVGPDVKVKSREQAEEMALKFLEVGKRLGMKLEVVLTNGSEPSGKAFGPALEAKYVMEILEGKISDNLLKKSCELAGTLLELAGGAKRGEGCRMATGLVRSGEALKKMQEIIQAQGGKILSSEEISLGKFKRTIDSETEGVVNKINVTLLNNIARIAGAPAHKRAGVMLFIDDSDHVKKGDPLFEIYAENERKIELAEKFARQHAVVEMERVILGKFG